MKEELARRAAHALLARMREGRIAVTEEWSGRSYRYGPPDAERSAILSTSVPVRRFS